MSRLPETGPSLIRHLRQQQRQMIRNENASPYSRSGSGVTAVDEVTYEGVLKVLGQMVVDGTLIVNGPLTVTLTADITGTTHIGGATDIDGTLNVDAATTIGGTLGVTGVTTLGAPTTVSGTLGVTGVTTLGAATSVTGALNVSGPMAVTGTLSLPAGIINNDALTSPVEVGDFDHSETGFDPVTGAGGWPTVSSVTLTVPDGFTQAVVTAVAYVAIRNTTPSTSTQIHTRCEVDGVGGPVDDERSEPGVRSTGLSMFPTRVTGLTGGATFDVACQAYAGADFAADAVNVATISGTVLWLR